MSIEEGFSDQIVNEKHLPLECHHPLDALFLILYPCKYHHISFKKIDIMYIVLFFFL